MFQTAKVPLWMHSALFVRCRAWFPVEGVSRKDGRGDLARCGLLSFSRMEKWIFGLELGLRGLSECEEVEEWVCVQVNFRGSQSGWR